MYLKFFGLKEEPFHITPDPEFLYLSPSHKEALALMVYGVEQRSGFISLTGGVGVGKTTIVRTLLEHCRQQQIRMISVQNSRVTFGVLMNMIYKELGLEMTTEDGAELVHGFYLFLIEEQKLGRNVVLVIDEAQNMSINTLGDLEKLSNLEAPQGKLLQILIVGQPELEAKLKLKELRQIQQRFGVRIKIAELTPNESFDYIRYRLTKAGMQVKETAIFTRAALRLIVKHSLGIPRKINIICDNALSSGFAYGMKPVPVKVVKDVIADLDGKPAGVSMKWVITCASLAFLFLVIAALAVVRIMDFPKKMDSKHSTASAIHTPAPPDDTPVPQSAPGSSTAPDSQPVSVVFPATESLKSHGDVAAGSESTVSPGNILPPGQGASQALPSAQGVPSRGSASIVRSTPQSEAGGTSEGKSPRIIEEAGGKTDISTKEPKASLPALSKTASGKIAEPVDHAVQKADKPVRGGEPAGPAGSPASKPRPAPEEDPPDPNKLMDWFMNKRAR